LSGGAISKTLLKQNPPVLIWGCWMAVKLVVVVVAAAAAAVLLTCEI